MPNFLNTSFIVCAHLVSLIRQGRVSDAQVLSQPSVLSRVGTLYMNVETRKKIPLEL